MEEYISVDDAARRMGRSRATIWNLIRRYELPTFRRPGERRSYVQAKDIDRLMGAFEPREASAAA